MKKKTYQVNYFFTQDKKIKIKAKDLKDALNVADKVTKALHPTAQIHTIVVKEVSTRKRK